VYTQRRNYKAGTLPPARKALLDDISSDFGESSQQRCSPTSTLTSKYQPAYVNAWQQRYQELFDFYEEHGHCTVPEDHGLHNWILTQRTRKQQLQRDTNRGSRRMTSDEIAKLDRIGFLWHFADKLEERWQENCRNLKAYKLEHADCNVPKVSPPPGPTSQ
jgi:hypothetical protein